MKSKIITFPSNSELELINITDDISNFVKLCGVKNGVAVLYAPHATGVILIGEDEPGLREDFLNFVKETFPKGKGYRHDKIDDNAHSHLMSSFLGSEKVVPVENGALQLGTWQSIFFLETDGPRSGRKVIVKIVE